MFCFVFLDAGVRFLKKPDDDGEAVPLERGRETPGSKIIRVYKELNHKMDY